MSAPQQSEVPNTGDSVVDAILADFAKEVAESDDLGVGIEAATEAHRQLHTRLSAHREH